MDVTPDIFNACRHNDHNRLKQYIENGGDVNLKNRSESLLSWIVAYNSKECFDILLEGGADVNIKSINNLTSLHYAAYNLKEDFSLILKLIKNGADINAQNVDGHTPLHLAALNNNPTFFKILLENGANYTIKNVYEFTPLDYLIYIEEGNFSNKSFVENYIQDLESLDIKEPGDDY